jgi:hypothetical protein
MQIPITICANLFHLRHLRANTRTLTWLGASRSAFADQDQM